MMSHQKKKNKGLCWKQSLTRKDPRILLLGNDPSGLKGSSCSAKYAIELFILMPSSQFLDADGH